MKKLEFVKELLRKNSRNIHLIKIIFPWKTSIFYFVKVSVKG